MLRKANSLDHSPAGDATIAPYIVICMHSSVVTVTVLVLGNSRIEESTVLTCVVFIHADILSRPQYVRSVKSANRSRRPSTLYKYSRAEKFASSYTSQHLYQTKVAAYYQILFYNLSQLNPALPQVRYQKFVRVYLVTPH